MEHCSGGVKSSLQARDAVKNNHGWTIGTAAHFVIAATKPGWAGVIQIGG